MQCPRLADAINKGFGLNSPGTFFSHDTLCILDISDSFSKDGFLFVFILWDVMAMVYNEIAHDSEASLLEAAVSRCRSLLTDHSSVRKVLSALKALPGQVVFFL